MTWLNVCLGIIITGNKNDFQLIHTVDLVTLMIGLFRDLQNKSGYDLRYKLGYHAYDNPIQLTTTRWLASNRHTQNGKSMNSLLEKLTKIIKSHLMNTPHCFKGA